MAANEALFNERVAQGYIRDCDGDIHMENICLTDRVWIFDCIEFNNRFRYSDTAADIAFLLMDFDLEGFPAFSDLFLDEYISATGDTGVVDVLDFYKVYRAVVRGKVESFRLRDSTIPGGREGRGTRDGQIGISAWLEATSFVASSRCLSSSPVVPWAAARPPLSTALARELGLERISSDVVRKQLVSMPEFTHSFTGIRYRASMMKEPPGKLWQVT